ncbi:uncharacterized protein N0V89_010818 [Didymosphaeria variabile]|uniref:Uncharacterized protein n=1 Tax=Didymosphaeria variabile TaxID=1932322 RepID=A0A9W8XCD8_9PLEO|nr:uncharacterized protein N0V89_010818 [Didymosphaeria variabile]KAJ4346885.1 hypothetical protein N0V89_010818 [Didymosphaeria variabile]
MCSRESKYQGSIFDPTISVLTTLITANRTLSSSVESSITRLRSLIPVLHTTPRYSTIGEATCIEAIAITEAALASLTQYTTFYAPLFDASDPITIIRQTGVVFAGDASNGGGVTAADEANIRKVISTMKVVVEYHGDQIRGLESLFRDRLDWIQLQRRLEGEKDEILLARRGQKRTLGWEEVEEMLDGDALVRRHDEADEEVD